MVTIRALSITLVLIAALFPLSSSQAARVSAGAQVGYNVGVGVSANAMLADFAQGFPMALRLTAGYTARQPGDANDARRIFINDATNGTPEEKGWFWDYRFDLMYDFGWSSVADIYVSGGVRYANTTANFKFIGGNEDFDVTSSQWGLGIGLDGFFDITQKLQFVLAGGIDYYFDSTLKGHDTEYSPDGDDVNPRRDYTYTDADAAINQPKWGGRAKIGISYWFGK
jgi:hypothetical protein